MYRNAIYDFCSETCKAQFEAEPSRYVATEHADTVASNRTTSEGFERIHIPILEMQCASCMTAIEKQIKKLPGIRKANVNYSTAKAYVEYDPRQVHTRVILGAIKAAGYQTGRATLNLGIRGMYCGSCVTKIEKELMKTPGVVAASVDLATESARIDYLPSVRIREIKNVIE